MTDLKSRITAFGREMTSVDPTIPLLLRPGAYEQVLKATELAYDYEEALTKISALVFDDNHWRSLWLVLPSRNRLHRVASIAWDDEDMITAHGTTLCGRHGELQMPGIFSRMCLPRCAHCCRMAGVPIGDGVPYNEGLEEADHD